MEPFYETARLLYEGPWVAERYLVIRNLLASSPDSMHPVTREIIARRRAAVGRRNLLRAVPAAGLAQASPSAPLPISTRSCCRPRRRSTRSRRCWPIRSSSTAGSAPTRISSTCSICAGWRCRRRCSPTARPSASRCWRRPATTRMLASDRPRIPRRHRLADRRKRAAAAAAGAACRERTGGDIAIAVVGAHLSGMPLNGELRRLAGGCSRATATAPDYRLYALVAPRRRSPACCASRRQRRARSRWKSGRWRRRRSAD